MVSLSEIVEFCAKAANVNQITDFDGAMNGLQIENNGTVSCIGAAVDAGLVPFQKAVAEGVDFLICHHGLFWTPPIPLTGVNRAKVKFAFDHNLAVYGAHLPLDCHPELGNNACLAKALGLKPVDTFLPYEGNHIGLITEGPANGRHALAEALKSLFPQSYQAMEFGSDHPERIAILTGSGQSAVNKLKAAGVDTLVTGELRQNHFNIAQELKLNLYPCGHYATETFGVKALGELAAKQFGLPFKFIPTECPL